VAGADDENNVAKDQADAVIDPDKPHRLSHGRWWQRPTMRQLKRAQKAHSEIEDQLDIQRNNDTRLPEGISVHLGGLTLTEAFTPSTVTNLYGLLKKWPRPVGAIDEDWITRLERGRSSVGGGWVRLGVVRRPGQFIMGDGHHDSTLPSGVQAAWLTLSFLVPSVAIVCATFTFEDYAADLSDLLRSDYHTVSADVQIVVSGPLHRLRSWFPWSRPKRYALSSRFWDAMLGKQRAVQQRIRQREEECERWFYGRFKGRFCVADSAVRPIIRLMFTEQAVPFEGRDMWRETVEMNWSPDVYRSTDLPGWRLKASPWPTDDRLFAKTIGAQRSDVGTDGAEDRGGQSNWSLTQRFQDDQAGLTARFALRALLDIYSACLAKLRDDAGKTRRIRRPVRDALKLDAYLLRDGLDAATITADVKNLTENANSFGWGVPAYTEDLGELPMTLRTLPPTELVPWLCSALQALASRLAADTTNTEGNIRGSAELRQAISNTRWQRAILVFTVAVLAVALVSLFHG
jgi:hypothetical protein